MNLAELAAERGDWTTAVAHYERSCRASRAASRPWRASRPRSTRLAASEAVRVLREVLTALRMCHAGGLARLDPRHDPDASQRDGERPPGWPACLPRSPTTENRPPRQLGGGVRRGRRFETRSDARRALAATETVQSWPEHRRRIILYEARGPNGRVGATPARPLIRLVPALRRGFARLPDFLAGPLSGPFERDEGVPRSSPPGRAHLNDDPRSRIQRPAGGRIQSPCESETRTPASPGHSTRYMPECRA